MRWIRTAGACIAFMGLLSCSAPLTAQKAKNDPVFSGTGVALTPRNFPRHTAADVSDMFKTGKKLGKYAVFIYQWSQPDFLPVAREMMKQSREWGLTPVIALSPTVLEAARGKLDLPKEVQKKARGKASFRDKTVHTPFIEAAVGLGGLRPPYLCLATEINFLAFADIQEYIAFAHIYKQAYAQIKKISPETKIFVSFQWDYFFIMDSREPNKVKEHTKLIDIFRPELDLVAFTTYPADEYKKPSDIPRDYYEKIYQHISRDDEVCFMEVGWPASGQGDEQKQVEYINRLPQLMENIRPKMIAWSLLHDVRASGLSGTLAATGLIQPDGRTKSAFGAFQGLQEK